MKNFLWVLALGLLLSGNAYADEIPDYSDDINENMKVYGWKINDTKLANKERTTIEIVTMSNKGWIIKCGIFYSFEKFIRTSCSAP